MNEESGCFLEFHAFLDFSYNTAVFYRAPYETNLTDECSYWIELNKHWTNFKLKTIICLIWWLCMFFLFFNNLYCI